MQKEVISSPLICLTSASIFSSSGSHYRGGKISISSDGNGEEDDVEVINASVFTTNACGDLQLPLERHPISVQSKWKELVSRGRTNSLVVLSLSVLQNELGVSTRLVSKRCGFMLRASYSLVFIRSLCILLH